jgi:hypothetical protein
MQYKIVTNKQEYIVTEEDNTILIENSSLKDFLLDLDDCDTPYIIQIKEEGEN